MKTKKLVSLIVALSICWLAGSAFAQQSGIKPEINIVFMGKTGVGKSTLINIFYNHLSERKFEDKRDIVIPMLDSDGSETLVNVEKYKAYNVKLNAAGKSQTDHVHKYSVETTSYIINLWDTPGVLDVGGVLKDQENIEKIVHAFGEITVHAVAVVIDPNTLSRDSLELTASVNNLRRMLPKTFFDNLIGVFNFAASVKPTAKEGHRKTFERIFELQNPSPTKTNFIDGTSFFAGPLEEEDFPGAWKAKWHKDAIAVRIIAEQASKAVPAKGEDVLNLHNAGKDIETKMKALLGDLASHQAQEMQMNLLEAALQKDRQKRNDNQNFNKEREVEYEATEKQKDPYAFEPVRNILEINDWKDISGCMTPTGGFCKFVYRDVTVTRKKTITYVDAEQKKQFEDAVQAILNDSQSLERCKEAVKSLAERQKSLIKEIRELQSKRENMAMTTDADPYIKYLQAKIRLIENTTGMSREEKDEQIKVYEQWIKSYRSLSAEMG